MAILDYAYLAKLVTQAQNGNNDAFAEIYAITYQRQYTFAYHYLKDVHLAQDALQETYISALKNLSQLKDPSLLAAWLNQICFRVCYDIHRKYQQYHTNTTTFDEIPESQKPSSPDPVDTIVQIDSREYIMNQIMKLPFSESQAITMRYYQDLKIDEIAKVMGVSRSSVKRYLLSGRIRLKKLLE